MQKKTRTILLLIILLVVVGGGGYAGYKIYKRGTRKAGVYHRAYNAYASKNYSEAIRLARQVLNTRPESSRARVLLAQALLDSGAEAEAEALLQEWVKADPENPSTARLLLDLKVNQMKLQEAQELARSLADHHPAFTLWTLRRVGALTSNPSQRLIAADHAISLATLTDSSVSKAEALYFAAMIHLETGLYYVGPRMRDYFLRRARDELQRADANARSAIARYPGSGLELFQAQIRLHGPNVRDQRSALRLLKKSIRESEETPARFTGETDDEYAERLAKRRPPYGAMAALVRYYLGVDKIDDQEGRPGYKKSSELIRALGDAKVVPLWYWGVLSMAAAGHRDEAIALLEGAPFEKQLDELLILRARLQLRGDEASKNKGKALLEESVQRPDVSPEFVKQAWMLLMANGETESALRLLDVAKLERDEWPIEVWVAALVSADESELTDGDLVKRLTGQVKTLGQSARITNYLRNVDSAGLHPYLKEKIDAGGGDAAVHRALRANILLGQANKEAGEAARELRDAAFADLRAVADSGDASFLALNMSGQLALLAGDSELAGRLLSRAHVLEPGSDRLARLMLGRSVRLTEEDAVALAGGIRAAADGSDAKAYLEALAAAVAIRGSDLPALQAALDGAVEEAGSRPHALRLVALLADRNGEFERAAKAVERLAESEPESADVRDWHSAILLRTGDHEALVAAYLERPDKTVIQYRNVVTALRKLDRGTEGVKLAREARDAMPARPDAYLLLAQAYELNEERTKALGVLSACPPSRDTTRMRAALLLEEGEDSVAWQLFESLVYGSVRDLESWKHLYEMSMDKNRVGRLGNEFADLVALALQVPAAQAEDALRAQLLLMRGSIFDLMSRSVEALRDYESVIAIDARIWQALNNAAWIITRRQPERIETAQSYIDRALVLQPDQHQLLDTAAEVARRKKEYDLAIELLDRAFGLEDRPVYLLRKARILDEDKKDEGAWRDILNRIVEEYGGTPEAFDAQKELFGRYGRRKSVKDRTPPEDSGDAKQQKNNEGK